MGSVTFGTAINCIDGRTHLPVIDWMKRNYDIDYVDMITEPGLARGKGYMEGVEPVLKSKARISAEKHNSRVIVIAAHHKCAANDVPEKKHKEGLREVVDAVKKWGIFETVVGLWVYPEGTSWRAEQAF